MSSGYTPVGEKVYIPQGRTLIMLSVCNNKSTRDAQLAGKTVHFRLMGDSVIACVGLVGTPYIRPGSIRYAPRELGMQWDEEEQQYYLTGTELQGS